MNRTIENRLRVSVFLATAFTLSYSPQAQAQLPFFPGAEGFGGTFTGTAPAAGWFSDATVYHVTTTEDLLGADGKGAPGTLRGAFRENTKNKIIVFDVGGTIRLNKVLDIKNVQNYYIAGQTAPSPVTIFGNTTQITHSNNKDHFNTILRYMTFRKGLGNGADSITFAGGGANGIATNMIIDHVSASWAEDETLSVTNYNTNITVQYTMMTDSITEDSRDGHQYGSLMRPKTDADVTFHHNLYANDKSRNPRMGSYEDALLTLDFVDNVVYNWSDRAGYAGGGSDNGTPTEKVNVNWVGNYVIAGPTTPLGSKSTTAVTKDIGGNNPLEFKVYQAHNLVDWNHDAIRDGEDTGWDMFRVSNGLALPESDKASVPFAAPPVTTTRAAEAYTQVIGYVGNWWWERDQIDARVIGNVVNNTQPPGGIPALEPEPNELAYVTGGAYPNAPATHSPAYDLDNDGMADEWEAKHGGNLVWNQDFDNDGYINLVEFINEKGEFPAPAPIVFSGAANSRYAQITNWKTDDGGISAGSNWQPSKFDVAVIKSGTVVVDAVGQHAGTLHLGVESGDDATLSVTGGWIDVADQLLVGSSVGTGHLDVGAAGIVQAGVVVVGELGSVTGTGTILGGVANNGVVSPGASPGKLSVDGDFGQGGTGVLVMEIDSTSSFDQLDVGGELVAGGFLAIELNYSPTAGDAFDLFDFGFASGEFLVQFPMLDTGLAWDFDNLLVDGVLAVVESTTVKGDFDGDGDVDGRDFLRWQREFNPGTGLDASDLADWEANFGAMPEGLSAVVPEPSAIVLLGMLAISTMLTRRK